MAPRSRFSTKQCSASHGKGVTNCLHTVTTLLWPARSLDLSPIENIWVHLGRRVGHPTSLSELEAILQQIWNKMSQDIIQNLYASMPYCITSCISARGGSTGDRTTNEPAQDFSVSTGKRVSKQTVYRRLAEKALYARRQVVCDHLTHHRNELVFYEAKNMKIGSRVGRNQTTVMRISDRWMQESTTDCRGQSHPPHCTTSREDRTIVRMAVTDQSVTSQNVAQNIQSVTHHSVSAPTIRRRLQQSGLSTRRPLLGLPLTQNHRRLRRQ
ncbi:transposable element Tcb1 transposase [Trichonephila clavipes]|uniref:Transposable element Tcb1 transposase n=1 Tax=Trichonephila clavipes TaxID=2585209 RepID=A0A8X6S1J9_TRICX|nr:transposable element Tcb1 transposase [Trichonephila clavipes]